MINDLSNFCLKKTFPLLKLRKNNSIDESGFLPGDLFVMLLHTASIDRGGSFLESGKIAHHRESNDKPLFLTRPLLYLLDDHFSTTSAVSSTPEHDCLKAHDEKAERNGPQLRSQMSIVDMEHKCRISVPAMYTYASSQSPTAIWYPIIVRLSETHLFNGGRVSTRYTFAFRHIRQPRGHPRFGP